MATGREEEAHEGGDLDAGDDAIVDVVHMDRAEAMSHEYHRVPAAREAMVMPSNLEDAPTSAPPATAMAKGGWDAVPYPKDAAKPRAKRHAARPLRESRDVVLEAAIEDAVLVEPLETKTKTPARKAKPRRDPIAESFVPYGASGIRPMGTRQY